MPTAAPDAVALTAMIASLPLMLTRRNPPISYAYERFTSKNFLVGTSPTQYRQPPAARHAQPDRCGEYYYAMVRFRF